MAETVPQRVPCSSRDANCPQPVLLSPSAVLLCAELAAFFKICDHIFQKYTSSQSTSLDRDSTSSQHAEPPSDPVKEFTAGNLDNQKTHTTNVTAIEQARVLDADAQSCSVSAADSSACRRSEGSSSKRMMRVSDSKARTLERSTMEELLFALLDSTGSTGPLAPQDLRSAALGQAPAAGGSAIDVAHDVSSALCVSTSTSGSSAMPSDRKSVSSSGTVLPSSSPSVSTGVLFPQPVDTTPPAVIEGGFVDTPLVDIIFSDLQNLSLAVGALRASFLAAAEGDSSLEFFCRKFEGKDPLRQDHGSTRLRLPTLRHPGFDEQKPPQHKPLPRREKQSVAFLPASETNVVPAAAGGEFSLISLPTSAGLCSFASQQLHLAYRMPSDHPGSPQGSLFEVARAASSPSSCNDRREFPTQNPQIILFRSSLDKRSAVTQITPSEGTSNSTLSSSASGPTAHEPAARAMMPRPPPSFYQEHAKQREDGSLGAPPNWMPVGGNVRPSVSGQWMRLSRTSFSHTSVGRGSSFTLTSVMPQPSNTDSFLRVITMQSPKRNADAIEKAFEDEEGGGETFVVEENRFVNYTLGSAEAEESSPLATTPRRSPQGSPTLPKAVPQEIFSSKEKTDNVVSSHNASSVPHQLQPVPPHDGSPSATGRRRDVVLATNCCDDVEVAAVINSRFVVLFHIESFLPLWCGPRSSSSDPIFLEETLLAYSTTLQREVILKCFTVVTVGPDPSRGIESHAERRIADAQKAAKIHEACAASVTSIGPHPNLVPPALEYVEMPSDGPLRATLVFDNYLGFELSTTTSTWERLAEFDADGKTNRTYGFNALLPIAEGVAAGLEYLHANGFVHGSICPETILVRKKAAQDEHIEVEDVKLCGVGWPVMFARYRHHHFIEGICNKMKIDTAQFDGQAVDLLRFAFILGALLPPDEKTVDLRGTEIEKSLRSRFIGLLDTLIVETLQGAVAAESFIERLTAAKLRAALIEIKRSSIADTWRPKTEATGLP